MKPYHAIKQFFKNDYYHIYLRSGVWLTDAKVARRGNQACLRCYQSITQAISGCSTNSQQILKYRYQQGLKVREVMSKTNLSQGDYYKREQKALHEFIKRLGEVASDLLEAIENEYT